MIASREAANMTPSTPPIIPDLNLTISRTSLTTGVRKLHLARMELPSFSGNIKNYPSFREDWKSSRMQARYIKSKGKYWKEKEET